MREHDIDDRGMSPGDESERLEALGGVCPECGGTGVTVEGEVCPTCDGRGRVSEGSPGA